MEWFLAIIAITVVAVLPTTALVLAILAYQKISAVTGRLDALKRAVEEIALAQSGLQQRVGDLEKARRVETPRVPAEETAAAEGAAPVQEAAPTEGAAPADEAGPAAEAARAAAAETTRPTGPPPSAPPTGKEEEELDLEEELAAPVAPASPAVAPSGEPEQPPQPPIGASATAAQPETPRGLERQFGTRVAVWLGAVALALAGGFLVKYTVERGLIGPAARVGLGLTFGLCLLGIGEWVAKRYRDLAQGLEAAGIAVLYSVLLAGFRLYGLYSPTVAFAGMALTTATAVVLSLRRGPFVAVLGMLGGFLTPILIGSEAPGAWTLLVYLLVLESGLATVSRHRRWWPVAGLTLVGVLGWALWWMTHLSGVGGSTFHIALLLVASMVWFVMSARSMPSTESWGGASVPTVLVWGATAPGTVLLAALVGVGDFGLTEWTFFGLVGLGCIVVARLETEYEGLAWIAALAGAGMLWVWGAEDSHPRMLLWRVALVLAALFAAGAYSSMWRAIRPDRWAALASVSVTAYFLTAYAVLREGPFPVPWGLQALLLAAAVTLLALPVARRRDTLVQGSAALAAFAVTVTTLVSLAVPMELERAWISVAWATEIVALAWIAARLRVPRLETLAWIMGGLVAIRLLLNPAVLAYPIGEGVLFNWLLYGYGIPIGAFAVGALMFLRNGSEQLAEALEVGAILLGLGYLTLEVRQYFHPGDLDAASVVFAEWGAWAVIWMVYAVGLLVLHGSARRRAHLVLGCGVGWAAVATALLIAAWIRSPLWTGEAVGSMKVFNRVLWTYGIPALLAVVLARMFGRRQMRASSWVAGGAALVLGFLTLTLEVRQAFHGAVLRGGVTTDGEMYTYSLVWVLFAIALLVAGIVTRGTVVRYGSSVVMLVAVGKVFLVDTAELQDLYRVFSLLGLGVTLMVLAWIYQRFVFREPRP